MVARRKLRKLVDGSKPDGPAGATRSCAIAPRIGPPSCVARAVGVIPRALRVNSGSPNRTRRRARALLMPGWLKATRGRLGEIALFEQGVERHEKVEIYRCNIH